MKVVKQGEAPTALSEGERIIQEMVKVVNSRRPPFWRRNGWAVAASLFVIVVGVLIWFHPSAPSPTGQPSPPSTTSRLEEIHLDCEILSFPLAVIAFLVGYAQWRAGRHEISLDKYYDRLDLFNQRLEKMSNVDTLDMLVYTQLDTMEYTIQKYNLNYVRRPLMQRAFRAFESSCQDAPFRNRVVDVLQRSHGFEETTRAVAQVTCDLIARRQAGTVSEDSGKGHPTKESDTAASRVQR